MKVAILLDDVTKINFTVDATIDLARCGIDRGYEIYVFFPDTLVFEDGAVRAICIKLDDPIKTCLTNVEEKTLESIDLRTMDVILVRHDPPYNLEYLTSCYLLDVLEHHVLFVNKPSSIVMSPEKLWIAKYHEIHPPTIITSNIHEIVRFRKTHGDIILKPLYDYRGEGVFFIDKKNKNFFSTISLLKSNYQNQIIAQKYLPEVRLGDKRIFLLDGVPIAAINRIPSNDEARSNMYAGGTAFAYKLSDNDLNLCEKVGTHLSRLGLVLVGVDIIGNYITEINVTSPTGIVQIKELCDIDISNLLWTWVEKKLQ